MKLHDKGAKAERDRVALIKSYEVMCRVVRVSRRNRITPAQFAAMANGQIMQACRDLYNGSTIRQAKRIERIMNPPAPLVERIIAWTRLKWAMLKARAYLAVMNARRIEVPRVAPHV